MSRLNKKYGISFMDFINLTFDLLQFCDLAGVPFIDKKHQRVMDELKKDGYDVIFFHITPSFGYHRNTGTGLSIGWG